jgi:uncharacterized membrane protein
MNLHKDMKFLLMSGLVFLLGGLAFLLFGTGNFGLVCILLGAALIGISFTIKPKSDG